MAKSLEPAGFLVRVFAVLADQFLLGALAFGCIQAASTVTTYYGMTQSTYPLVAGLLAYVAGLLYFRLLVVRYGATPGKRNFRIVIVREDGSPLLPSQALGRMLLEPLSFGVFGLGVMMVAFRGDKRALHDIVLRTRVVLLHSLPPKSAVKVSTE